MGLFYSNESSKTSKVPSTLAYPQLSEMEQGLSRIHNNNYKKLLKNNIDYFLSFW